MIFVPPKYIYFIVILTSVFGLFIFTTMILIICAHTALTHFSVSCFDDFFKHFKRFCGRNINRKRIPKFWSKRSKTFCAKFVIIWLGHNEIILVLHSFRPSIWFFKDIFHIAWIQAIHCSIYFCTKIFKSLNRCCRFLCFLKKSVIRFLVFVK